MDDPSAPFWLLAAAAAALALLATWADRRRGNRPNLDRPGWVPWQLILVLSLMAGAVCVALAILL